MRNRKYKRIYTWIAIGMLCISGCGNSVEYENDNALIQDIAVTKKPILTTVPQATPTISEKPTPTMNGEQTEVDYTAIYQDVLEQYFELMVSGNDEVMTYEGSTGVLEVVNVLESKEALETVGYMIFDVSGDSVPELMIGAIPKEHFSNYGNCIYAMYSYVDGTINCILEGWGRNSYYLLENGNFYNQASGGAMYSIFGEFVLSLDGKKLIYKDYYFTYEKDESFTEIGYYHNITGEFDKSKSEELNMTAEDFWNISSVYEKQIQNIELIPFVDYKEF